MLPQDDMLYQMVRAVVRIMKNIRFIKVLLRIKVSLDNYYLALLQKTFIQEDMQKNIDSFATAFKISSKGHSSR